MRSACSHAKLCVALFTIAVLALGCPSGTVPDVRGMTLSDATAALTSAGMSVGNATEQYDAFFPSGQVISQTPQADAAVKPGPGTSVDLVLSRGQAPVAVPNLVGLTRDEAKQALFAVGLALGPTTEKPNATIEKDHISSHVPASGAEVAPGTAVSVQLSSGAYVAMVPDLTGMTRDAAEAALVEVGLTLGAVTMDYSDYPLYMVAEQDPLPQRSAALGSGVAIVLSQGPAPRLVPSLISMTISQATTALTFARLTIGTTTESWSEVFPSGRIISQSPSPGSYLEPQSPVDLVVSKGREPITVPDVVAISSAEAVEQIEAARLTVELVEEFSQTIPIGEVVSQLPAAGATAYLGSVIRLTISKGREPVAVPDLTTLSQADAEATLQAAGLVLGTITEVYDLSAPTGTVLSQQPVAGTTVYKPDPVNVVLALDRRPIRTIEELQLIGNDPSYPIDADYVLVKDIDASPATTWNNGKGFQAIGKTEPFSGTLDGRGHAIAGLMFKTGTGVLFNKVAPSGIIHDVNVLGDSSSAYANALLVVNNEGTIRDCSIQAVIEGYLSAGGIVSRNYYGATISRCRFIGTVTIRSGFLCGGIAGTNDGLIENCEASGTIEGSEYVGGIAGASGGTISGCAISATIRGGEYVGGIVGYNGASLYECPECDEAVITDCRTDCHIEAWGMYTGGVVGTNAAQVTRCAAYGSITSSGVYAVGGLVGYNYRNISDSFSVGDVWSKGYDVGGLVGYNAGLVQNCFSTGRVQAFNACGGLSGGNKGEVLNSYSLSRVDIDGGDVVGGLLAGNSGTATGCFWVPDVSGQAASAGGTPITTAQLLNSSTFSEWDHESVWAQQDNLTVPYLKWTEQAGVLYQLEVQAEGGNVSTIPAAGQYPLWTFVSATQVPAAYPFAGWSDGTLFDGTLLTADAFYVVMHGGAKIIGAFLPAEIEIKSIEELEHIGRDPLYPLDWDYVLTRDLDASETVQWNDHKGFKPIAASRDFPFAGNFDGQCHTIYNLHISDNESSYVGLFGVVGVDASVKDLAIEGGNVTGSYTVGMLAGWNCGTLSRCASSGTVIGCRAGGLVGYHGGGEMLPAQYSFQGLMEACSSSCFVSEVDAPFAYNFVLGGLVAINNAQIRQSSATGTVTGTYCSGGFAGQLNFGTIVDCYATTSVEAPNAAGFVAEGEYQCIIRRCYSAGRVEGSYGCAFLGMFGSQYPYDCFTDLGVAGCEYSGRAFDKTTAEMMTAATFTAEGWDFTDVWDIQEGQSYPFLRAQTGCD